MEFAIFPTLYNEEMDFSLIFAKILNTFFCFIVLTIMGMMVTYIAQIRGKLTSLIAERLTLFDKMHEGLILLDAIDNSLIMASQPAAHLLKKGYAQQQPQRLNESSFCGPQAARQELVEADMLVPLFKPQSVTINKLNQSGGEN